MVYYVEWAKKLNSRYGNMVKAPYIHSVLALHEDPGYRSVYMFSEENATQIMASKSSSGFGQYSVYSDTLFIDLDDGFESVPAIKASLMAKDIGFTLWDSGNKGAHFHVNIDPMEGVDVPYSQQMFVGQRIETADLSIYRASSLIALPGRVHPVTNNPKKLVETYKGSIQLKIPLVTPVTQQLSVKDYTVEMALKSMLKLITQPPRSGGRQQKLWSVADIWAKAGISYETTEELIHFVGTSMGKDPDDLQRLMREAYRK